MKKLLLLLMLTSVCFADESTLGTPDKPQIDGMAYDLSKPYIEPNAGYTVANKIEAGIENSDSRAVVSEQQPIHQHIIVKQNNNLANDSWITDSARESKVERALKKAATDGKLNYVLEEAKQKNIPASVAIVPMVESNYNKNAISPKGAGGAWQLMPKTASNYGVSPSGRFDFKNSTHAAIELLNDLHQEFGNWNLAFAAYNCGSQCVINALRRNPNATDFDELALPDETKAYVHKIIQFNQVIAGLDNGNKK